MGIGCILCFIHLSFWFMQQNLSLNYNFISFFLLHSGHNQKIHWMFLHWEEACCFGWFFGFLHMGKAFTFRVWAISKAIILPWLWNLCYLVHHIIVDNEPNFISELRFDQEFENKNAYCFLFYSFLLRIIFYWSFVVQCLLLKSLVTL